MSLLVPEHHAFNAKKNAMIAEWSRHDHLARELEAELKTIDRHLEVYFVDPRAANNENEHKAIGVVPGRWHIVRRADNNTGGLDAWFPLMGPNQELVEPSLAVIEQMKKADLWRPGALKELRDAQVKEADEKARAEVLKSEHRIDESREAFRAAKRMPGAGGMFSRASSKGGLTEAERARLKARSAPALPAGGDE